MTTRRLIAAIVLPLAMATLVATADAQGKGKGNGQGQKSGKVESKSRGGGKAEQKGPAKSAKVPAGARKNGTSKGIGQGKSSDKAARGNSPASANASPRALIATGNRGSVKRLERDLRVSEVRPVVRTYLVSNRPSRFVTGGAVAYALARGTPENALLVVPVSNQVFLRNRRGEDLLVLDDNRARTLGSWQVAPLDNRVKNGSPSFCRSGAGHPVWGRQWCLDKGFGLGTDQDVRWGTTRTVSDIIFGRRPTSATLPRNALLGLLGQTAFDRLALHAVTLGYTDPLTGVWHSEATGPEVLLINSGRYPIAELVDTNRDQRADLMLVALRPW